MLRTTISVGIALTLTLNAAQAAILPPPNSASCMAALINARQNRDAGGISEAARHFALLNQRWGSRSAEESGTPLTFQNLNLDSRVLADSSSVAEVLGQQLHSLDQSIRQQELPEDERTFSFITGASIAGGDAIAKYLDAQEELALSLATLRKPQEVSEWLVSAIYLWFATASPHYAFISIMDVAQRLQALMEQGSLHPSVIVSIVGGWYWTEMSGRILLDRDWRIAGRTEQWKALSKESSASRSWLYRSWSHRMPTHVVASSQLPSALTILSMRMKDTDTGFGRIVGEKIFKRVSRDAWIFVDELLSRDPQTQEPVLSVIVRITEDSKRPRPPRPKKKATEAQRKFIEDGI